MGGGCSRAQIKNSSPMRTYKHTHVYVCMYVCACACRQVGGDTVDKYVRSNFAGEEGAEPSRIATIYMYKVILTANVLHGLGVCLCGAIGMLLLCMCECGVRAEAVCQMQSLAVLGPD